MPDPGDVLRFSLSVRRGDFSLDVDAGFGPGITALFGPSGSGKTITLQCLAGVRRPDDGEIVLSGRTLYSRAAGVFLPPERRQVAIVFQGGALFPHMDVAGNIEYGWRLTPRERRRVDVDDVVELLGLGPLMDRSPAELSGGETQRVALARALAMSPELLLLDEPLASLDARLRGVTLSYLRRIHRDLGIPMVYVSHSISEVIALADQALVLLAGRAVAFGRPSRVLLEPALGGLVEGEAIENLLEGAVVEPGGGGAPGRVRVGDAELVTGPTGREPGTPVMVAIGAGEIILACERPSKLSARNILPGVVVDLAPGQDRVLATVDVGARLLVDLSPEAVRELGLQRSTDVYLVCKSSSISVLDAAP